METKHIDHAKTFKAFCDENRLIILEMLQSGEKCACVLLEKMKITQPTLSHHMKILVESGIVTSRKEGKWTYYSINMTRSENAVRLLQKLTTVTFDEADTSNEIYCKEEIENGSNS
jgi:ArsR family transcriptional regulator